MCGAGTSTRLYQCESWQCDNNLGASRSVYRSLTVSVSHFCLSFSPTLSFPHTVFISLSLFVFLFPLCIFFSLSLFLSNQSRISVCSHFILSICCLLSFLFFIFQSDLFLSLIVFFFSVYLFLDLYINI